MYCNVCGNEIQPGETFCPTCGEEVSFSEQTPDYSYEPRTVGYGSDFNKYNGVQDFSDNIEEPSFGEASRYTGSSPSGKLPLVLALIALAAIIVTIIMFIK